MNRERAKQLLPIIEAFANGEDIQARSSGVASTWKDVIGNPEWLDSCEYRIEPKPREWYIAKKDIPESGNYGHRVYLTTCDHSDNSEFIHVREVLDQS